MIDLYLSACEVSLKAIAVILGIVTPVWVIAGAVYGLLFLSSWFVGDK